MINPNKDYKTKPVFKIISIDGADRGLWLVKVKDENGNIFEGYLDKLTKNPKRFKIDDKVKINCRFSIMADTWVISKITKRRI